MSLCLTVADFEAFESSQLAGDENARVRVHLDSCAERRSAYEQYRQSHATLSRPPVPRVDETAPRLAAPDGPETPATARSTSPARKMARHLPRIEGYRIMGVLGQGGMGIVYRAAQTKLNRLVALKVLPAIVSTASPAAASRFRREATAAARLHHTNIVPICDYGESQDAYYFAMEPISGQPMNTLIHRFAEHSVASASPAHLVEILRRAVTEPSPPGTGEMGVRPTALSQPLRRHRRVRAAHTTNRSRAGRLTRLTHSTTPTAKGLFIVMSNLVTSFCQSTAAS